jgi:hypothetical protein
MDLQEILTEIGEEKAAIVNAAIASEQKKGIDASKKKGAENTKLISEIAKMKDAIKEVVGIDDFGDDPVETIKEKISALKTAKPTVTNDDAIKNLEASFKKQLVEMKNSFNTQLENEKKEAEIAKAKYRNSKITEKLSKEMANKIKGHDIQIENWILKNKVRLDENDNVVFIGDSEDETIDSKKYLETFAKERSDLVISQQIPGGGSAGNRVDIGKIKAISIADFNNLGSVEKAKYMSTNGKFI